MDCIYARFGCAAVCTFARRPGAAAWVSLIVRRHRGPGEGEQAQAGPVRAVFAGEKLNASATIGRVTMAGRVLRSRRTQDPEHAVDSEDDAPRASRVRDETLFAQLTSKLQQGQRARHPSGRAYGQRLMLAIAAIFVLGPELFEYTLVTTVFRYGIAAGKRLTFSFRTYAGAAGPRRASG